VGNGRCFGLAGPNQRSGSKCFSDPFNVGEHQRANATDTVAAGKHQRTDAADAVAAGKHQRTNAAHAVVKHERADAPDALVIGVLLQVGLGRALK